MILRDQEIIVIYHLFAVCVVTLDADIFLESLFIWHTFNFERCSIADKQIFASIIFLARLGFQITFVDCARIVTCIFPK